MASDLFVLVVVNASGNMEVLAQLERPKGKYIGKLATHYNVVAIYARADFDAREEMSILGRVARWLVREEIV